MLKKTKKKRRRRNVTWKNTEREVAKLLGGRRVPLSGSNSGHKTKGDVMGIPDWLYVEVKRDKQYRALIHDYHLKCVLKTLCVFQTQVGELVMFCLDQLVGARMEWDYEYVPIDLSRRVPKAIKLFERELTKAKNEGKDTLLLAFRLHNLYGIYCLTELSKFSKLEETFRGSREWPEKKRPGKRGLKKSKSSSGSRSFLKVRGMKLKGSRRVSRD